MQGVYSLDYSGVGGSRRPESYVFLSLFLLLGACPPRCWPFVLSSSASDNLEHTRAVWRTRNDHDRLTDAAFMGSCSNLRLRCGVHCRARRQHMSGEV